MNIQNNSNIYTINDAVPPSYAEATGSSASRPYNSEFDQRYSHVGSPSPSAPFPYPSNCDLNSTPVQSVYQNYESTQNQSRNILHSRTLITGARVNKTCNGTFVQFIWVVSVLASVGCVFLLIFRIFR